MTILIVGGGKMGLSHLAISSGLVGKGLVALCESSWPIRFIFDKLKFKTFSNIEEAFNAGIRIDGVIIATPTSTHYHIAKNVLARSIPCFIEKPLTLNIASSVELQELAREHNVFVQMGFVARYYATFVRLKSIIDSNVLGDVQSYVGRMSGNVITKVEKSGWRTNFVLGGGSLNEYGPHIIDLCRYLFGDVRELCSASKEHIYSINADDRISFSWNHLSGVAGNVNVDWCDSTRRKSSIEFTVNFENAVIFVDNFSLNFESRAGKTLTSKQITALSTPIIPPRVSFYLRGEEFTLQLEVFIEYCMRAKFRTDSTFAVGLQANISDGVAVDQLIDMIAKKVGLK